MVTGASKGIGLEIVRQIASQGVTTVILTARDETRGLEATSKLHDLGFSSNVIFHQLDVLCQDSIDRLAQFIKNKFSRLDILVWDYNIFFLFFTNLRLVEE